MIVYQIKNKVNGKSYIGSSQEFNIRIRSHIRSLREGTHENIYLQRAWNKYGESNFEINILFKSDIPIDRSDLYKIEKSFIEVLKSQYNNNGYNININTDIPPSRKGKPGTFTGKKHTEETKVKIKKARANQIMKSGFVHTQETKDKISSANKGRLSGNKNPFYGKKHSEEIIENNRLSHTGGRSPVARIIKNIDTGLIFNSISEAIKYYNIKNGRGVYAALKGSHGQKTSGGYRWEYAD